jgi:hypothetical protein
VGPGAPKPLKPVEGFVPLCHAPCVTLSEEWLIAPCLLGNAGEPKRHGRSGHLTHAQALASAEGQRPRTGFRLLSIGRLRLR